MSGFKSAEDAASAKNNFVQKAHYEPPWANTSIIGIAGSSGSGKTSLALAIVAQLNLPWVVILSMVTICHV
jgi:uridine kinase